MKFASTTTLLTMMTALAVGCAPANPPTDTGTQDSAVADTGTTSDGGFMALAPCALESDYMMAPAVAAITFGVGSDTYSPKCLTVRAGTSVSFTGMFTTHPLTPSTTRGTAGTPIQATATGTTASFTFANTGFFPFFCAIHGGPDGSGMAGVIRVIP